MIYPENMFFVPAMCHPLSKTLGTVIQKKKNAMSVLKDLNIQERAHRELTTEESV